MARLAARSPPPNEGGREGVGGTNEHATEETDGRRDRRVCIWIREIRAKASEREPSPLATCQVKKFGKNTHLRCYGLSIDPGREIEIVSLLSISPPTWVSPNFWVSLSLSHAEKNAINLARESGGEIREYRVFE